MVFYFTIRGGPCCNANSHIVLSSSDIICYVGKDKHENEFLIKYGWPGDIWFHVDSLSSAHVYFRVQTIGGISSNGASIPVTGIPIDDLPEDSVYDMMQIVKHNSISGSKLASTKIVYTPHSNLKKTFEMESGAVTYHNRGLCRYARCDKDRVRIKELDKTKTERVGVDFYAEFKGNERRLIEYKKQERQRQRLGINNSDYAGGEGVVELYDPIKDDVNTMRIRETRQGDDETGVDKALQALESLVFAPVPKSNTTRTTTQSNQVAADDGEDAVDHSPVWVQEAKARLIDTSPDIGFLGERGYTRQEATEALQESGGSRMVALKTLWQQPHNTHLTDATTDSDAVDDAATARLEEKEMLLAIFGEDEGVVFSDSENSFDCILPVASYEPPSRYSCPPPLLLEVYVDNGMAPHYPASSPPVLALVGGGLPEALLAKLTTLLSTEALERCTQEPGDPQVFTLVNFVAEAVGTIIEEETAALAAEAQAAKRLRQQESAERAKIERELAQHNQSEDQSSSSSDHQNSHTLVFKSEQERRAYAKKIMNNVGLQEPSKNAKQAAENRQKYRNTGVSDKSLIEDLFG
jgi:hypothetical protein